MSYTQKNVIVGRRKGYPDYPLEFKQRLVAASCEPGVSISKLAWTMVSMPICCLNGANTGGKENSNYHHRLKQLCPRYSR
jgi:hypothetical protein